MQNQIVKLLRHACNPFAPLKIAARRFTLGFLSITCIAFAVCAQSIDVPPPPGISQGPGGQESPPALKTQTIAIPIRVVVRDRRGHPVANLKKDDFQLYQDGQMEHISTFTAISELSNAVEVENGAPSGSATASAKTTAQLGGKAAAAPERFIAVFFDDMHLQAKDLEYTKIDADKYIVSLPSSDHVAIVTATGQGEVGFTIDRPSLHDAIMKLQVHPAAGGDKTSLGAAIRSGCPPMDYWEADTIINGKGETPAKVLAGATQDLLVCSGRDPNSMPPQVAQAIILNSARATIAQTDAQTDAVLRRIEEVVHGLSSLPGQRVIVLISPGFLYATHKLQLSDIIDRAIRSDVVVNTIETRRGFDGEAQVRLVNGMLSQHGGALSASALNQLQGRDNLDAVESTAGSASQELLSEIADSTGGRFFDGGSDYASAFSRIAGAPEFYYLLAYSPQGLSVDGKYHKVKVTLPSKSNFTIQARRGFYAPSRAETPEEAAKREIDDALFSDEEEHDLPVKFETQMQREASGLAKMEIKADVNVAQLDFRKVNGVSRENLTIAAAVFDKDGNYVLGAQKSDQMDLDGATLAQLAKNGFYVELDFDVNPGQYVVRLVARDSNDEGVSAENASVTVPDNLSDSQ